LNNLITLQDLVIVPLTLLVAYLVGNKIKNKHIKEFPYYKYFVWGLWAKIFAGLAFAGIYLFYYGGGDTVYYYWGTESIVRMMGKDFSTFLNIMAGNQSAEVFSMFDATTGWPTYWRDPNSFSVCRFNVPFYLLGLGSYLGNTVIMNLVLYLGVWRFYKMLVGLYPSNSKWLAIAVFFIPSVVFWSSGILKDSWTLTAILFMFTNFYFIFISKNKVLKNMLWLIFWSYISFSIRPYIFYVSIGSGLIWIGFSAIKAIKSSFLRTIALPFIIIFAWISGVFIIAQTSTMAGKRYSSVDAMLETAWIIQDDLKKDYYGGNSFDIGEFEPTLAGVVKKAPSAIIAGMFRPFIWEGNGILMILSGLEHLIMMLLFAYLIFKTRLFGFFTGLRKDPFLLALFVMALTFAFSVGLTTSNFGALVRYAIPIKMLMILVFVQLINKTHYNSTL
jgi:hypothetical protein